MASPEALAAAAPYAPHFTRPLEEVAEDLESFCHLLTKWSRTQNLVSRETIENLWTRHVADSLQVLKYLSEADVYLCDLGSGGGFPAVPLAIARKGTAARHLLIESSGKKAAFLRAAIRKIGLSARVASSRAEDLDSRETPDVVTARAVAPLTRLLGLAAPLFGPQTRGLFHKGREYRAELAEAAAQWKFDVLVHDSDTDAESVVLEISSPTLHR